MDQHKGIHQFMVNPSLFRLSQTPTSKKQSSPPPPSPKHISNMSSTHSTPKHASLQQFPNTRSQLLTYTTQLYSSLSSCLDHCTAALSQADATISSQVQVLFKELQHALCSTICAELTKMRQQYVSILGQEKNNDYAEAYEYCSLVRCRLSEIGKEQHWRETLQEIMAPSYNDYILETIRHKEHVVWGIEQSMKLKVSECSREIRGIIVNKTKESVRGVMEGVFGLKNKKRLSESQVQHVGEKEIQ